MKIIFFKTENSLNSEAFDNLIKRVSHHKREVLLKHREDLSTNTKLLSYVCLRILLCDYLKLENQKLAFCKNENGKPYVKGNPMFFNLSHTKDAFVVAISENEIGIDIEKSREINEKIKEKYFTEEEKKQDEILVWTKKEALIKLFGTGLKDISKADTNSADNVFFFNEKIEDFIISSASYLKEENKIIRVKMEKIIEEGSLLEEI